MNKPLKGLAIGGIILGACAGILGLAYGLSNKARVWVDEKIQANASTIKVTYEYDAVDFTYNEDDEALPSRDFKIVVKRNGIIDKETPVYVIVDPTGIGASTLTTKTLADLAPVSPFDSHSATDKNEALKTEYYSGTEFKVTFSPDTMAYADWGGFFILKSFLLPNYDSVGEAEIELEKGKAHMAQTSSSPSPLALSTNFNVLAAEAGTNPTASIVATLTPADVTDKVILWSTSDSAKVTISSSSTLSGEALTISGVAPYSGTVTITAKARAKTSITASCVVTYATGA